MSGSIPSEAAQAEAGLPATAAFAPVVLTAAYALSGLVGLAYEVLWARMLSLQFGVSIFGIIATVAAFMGGLGLGSWWGTRLAPRLPRPLLVFGLLELGVALFALAIPWLLAAANQLVDVIAQEVTLTWWYLIQGVVATLLLTLPALAMGAGFALVTRAGQRLGLSLGGLYGWNTVGGAVGALLPLALLPALGWLASTQIVAALGLGVGAAAVGLAYLLPARREDPRPVLSLPVTRLHWAYAGVGMASLMLEIGWTRLYGMVLLRTEYVLAIILAIYLAGIGLGSLAARHLQHPRWLTAIPVVAALGAVLSLWWLPPLSAWAQQATFSSLGGALTAQGLMLAALTLPVTLALGLWLPVLARRLGDETGGGPLLYAFNSVGAALGAVLAGTVLIPLAGTPGTVAVAALLLLAFGLAGPGPRWRWLAPPLCLALAWPVSSLPPVHRLLPAAQGDSRDLYVHEDAVSITHVTESPDGQRLLLGDLQRMDASTEPSAVRAQLNQARLPLLLHRDPRSVLFLGLGTGISAAGSLPFGPLERTAVELSQGAVMAARQWFAPVNQGVMAQLTLVRDDARRFLRSTQQRYDVIIGDLFHPDLVGRSALLSRQQFERARDRLSTQGIFVQWLALNQFDPASLDTVLRTFQQVFPQGQVFMDGFRLALVGRRGERPLAADLLEHAAGLSSEAREAALGGEDAWTWLGRYWGPVTVPTGPVQDEWAPRIEFALPEARYSGRLDVAATLDHMLARRPALETARQQLGVSAEDGEPFERAYAATQLAARSWLASLRGDANEGSRLLRLAYQANPRDRWVSLALAERLLGALDLARQRGMGERQALEAVLKIHPDHPAALRALWRQARAQGDPQRAADYRARLEQVDPLGRLNPGAPRPAEDL